MVQARSKARSSRTTFNSAILRSQRSQSVLHRRPKVSRT